MKQCCVCKEVKPPSDYHEAKGNRDNLHSMCKICKNRRLREARQARKGKTRNNWDNHGVRSPNVDKYKTASVFKLVVISKGEQTGDFTTSSFEEAKQAYACALDPSNFCIRVYADGVKLSFLESDALFLKNLKRSHVKTKAEREAEKQENIYRSTRKTLTQEGGY